MKRMSVPAIPNLPFVGCLRTPDSFYTYDVNTNEIIQIPDSTYDSLVRSSTATDGEAVRRLSADPVVQSLVEHGYLSPHRPEAVASPIDDDRYRHMLDMHLKYAVLEVSRACNFDCEYCVYSDHYPGRRDHSTELMDWSLVRESIDMLLAHCQHTDQVSIGFYGGEPLVAWNTIRRAIEYADDADLPSRPFYSLTTNGSLVTNDIALYLAARKVSVVVSLDGPSTIHNAKRRFRGGNDGTYSATMRGIRRLRRAYGDSARYNMRLNTVIGPWTDPLILRDFFVDNPPEEIRDLHYTIGPVTYDDGVEIEATGDGHEEGLASLEQQWREELKRGGINSLPESNTDSAFLQALFGSDLLRMYNRPRNLLGDRIGPTGQCLPGIRKFLIDVDGRILLCEKASESLVLGHVHDGGISFDKAMSIVRRLCAFFDRRCPNCVMCRVCSGCAAMYSNSAGDISDEAMDRHCKWSFRRWQKILLDWLSRIEDNPTCFDYMEGITIS